MGFGEKGRSNRRSGAPNRAGEVALGMTLPPLLVEGPLLPSPLPGRGWDLLPAHWPAEQGLSEEYLLPEGERESIGQDTLQWGSAQGSSYWFAA